MYLYRGTKPKKSYEQTKILENEFQKSMYWNLEKINRLSEVLGLEKTQIYKWNWDRRLTYEKNVVFAYGKNVKICPFIVQKVEPDSPTAKIFNVVKVDIQK